MVCCLPDYPGEPACDSPTPDWYNLKNDCTIGYNESCVYGLIELSFTKKSRHFVKRFRKSFMLRHMYRLSLQLLVAELNLRQKVGKLEMTKIWKEKPVCITPFYNSLLNSGIV